MSDRDTKDLLGPKGKGKRVSRDAPTERLRPVGSEPAPEFKGEHICSARPAKQPKVVYVASKGWMLRVPRDDGAPTAFVINVGPIAGCPWCLRELEDQR